MAEVNQSPKTSRTDREVKFPKQSPSPKRNVRASPKKERRFDSSQSIALIQNDEDDTLSNLEHKGKTESNEQIINPSPLSIENNEETNENENKIHEEETLKNKEDPIKEDIDTNEVITNQKLVVTKRSHEESTKQMAQVKSEEEFATAQFGKEKDENESHSVDKFSPITCDQKSEPKSGGDLAITTKIVDDRFEHKYHELVKKKQIGSSLMISNMVMETEENEHLIQSSNEIKLKEFEDNSKKKTIDNPKFKLIWEELQRPLGAPTRSLEQKQLKPNSGISRLQQHEVYTTTANIEPSYNSNSGKMIKELYGIFSEPQRKPNQKGTNLSPQEFSQFCIKDRLKGQYEPANSTKNKISQLINETFSFNRKDYLAPKFEPSATFLRASKDTGSTGKSLRILKLSNASTLINQKTASLDFQLRKCEVQSSTLSTSKSSYDFSLNRLANKLQIRNFDGNTQSIKEHPSYEESEDNFRSNKSEYPFKQISTSLGRSASRVNDFNSNLKQKLSTSISKNRQKFFQLNQNLRAPKN